MCLPVDPLFAYFAYLYIMYYRIFTSLQTCLKSRRQIVRAGFHLETSAPSKNQSRFRRFTRTYRRLSRLR